LWIELVRAIFTIYIYIFRKLILYKKV